MRKHSSQSGFSIVEVLIIVIVLAVVGLLGWKFYDAKFNQPQVNNAVDKANASDMVPEALAELTDIKTIQQSALADKPGVTVIHIELEQSSSGLVYKAQLSDGTVTVYNARTGAHVRSGVARETTSEVLPTDLSTGISFAKALEVARAEKPSSKVYKIELEQEAGTLVYSVRFSDKARVDVNAQSGAIVRTKAARVDKKAESAAEPKSSPAPRDSKSSSSSKPAGDNSSSKSRSVNSGHSHDSSSDDHDDDDLSDNDDDDDDDDDDDSGKDRNRDDDNSGSGSSRR